MLNCWESVIETLRTMQFKLSESKCVDAKEKGTVMDSVVPKPSKP